eukprot:967038-Prorocentrum_minimum.AAC.2
MSTFTQEPARPSKPGISLRCGWSQLFIRSPRYVCAKYPCQAPPRLTVDTSRTEHVFGPTTAKGYSRSHLNWCTSNLALWACELEGPLAVG